MTKAKIIKGAVIFLIIQLALLWLWVLLFQQEAQATSENTEEITFYADHVEKKETHGPRGRGGIDIRIHYGSEEYVYDSEASDYLKNHSLDDLVTKLSEEKLTVTYRKTLGKLGGFYNGIVAIRGEKTVFYTVEDYNKAHETEMGLGIFLCSFAEIVYLFFFFAWLILLVEIKLPFSKKRKKKKHKENRKKVQDKKTH